MNALLPHALAVFTGFFAIMNPIANTPIFISLTEDEDEKTTRALAIKSLILAFLIVAAFSLAGKIIFALFGITLPAFQMTGGILVALIGFHMLQGNQSSVHQLSEEEHGQCKEAELSIAVSPLAMPILAGPGTLATAMNFSSGGFMEMAITLVAFAMLCLITYVFFIFGKRFVTFIGVGALGVITRLMGLILAVIGTQMVVEGLQSAFKLSG